MIICNQEFNFSALNADDIDRMEAASKQQISRAKAEARRLEQENAGIVKTGRTHLHAGCNRVQSCYRGREGCGKGCCHRTAGAAGQPCTAPCREEAQA